MDNRGFAMAKLLMIVVLGIVVGGAVYGAYRYIGQKPGALILPKGGVGQPTITRETKNLKPTTKAATATPELKEQEQKGKAETSSAKGNFSHQGALIAKEDGWILLWDEPGRMALNVKLKFTDQSVCIFGGEKKDCGLINLGPESYNRASVEGDRVDDEVTVIKMEELPSYE